MLQVLQLTGDNIHRWFMFQSEIKVHVKRIKIQNEKKKELKMSAPVKFYYDLMSQPSRALYIFMKLAKIPFEENPIALRKGKIHKCYSA